MNPGSVDLKDIIENETSFVFGIDLFIGNMPSSPKDCLCLRDVSAGEQDPKWAIEEIYVQICGRSIEYLKGYKNVKKIQNIFDGMSTQVINGTKYIGIWTFVNIGFVSMVENNLNYWTCTLRILREPEEASKGNKTII